VLECRGRGHREHLPARYRQRGGQLPGRLHGAAHRRDRRQGTGPRAPSGAVHRLGAVLTAAFYFVAKGDWSTAAILYIGASLGFWGGNQFYDSLLTDVAQPSEYDLASGYGFALGYLGGGLLFAVNVAMVTHPGWFGLADATDAVKWSFVSVGVWWMA